MYIHADTCTYMFGLESNVTWHCLDGGFVYADVVSVIPSE